MRTSTPILSEPIWFSRAPLDIWSWNMQLSNPKSDLRVSLASAKPNMGVSRAVDYNKLQTKSNYTYTQLTTKITVFDEGTL